MDTIQIIVSIDNDDLTIKSDEIQAIHKNITVCSGVPNGKIDAVNRDMPDTSTFDILLLASDDMIPIVAGYDDIIRTKMKEYFPDGDGVLWFNDGYTKYKLNTLVICGSKYYSRFGYIYNPEYKSLWCDNEFMDEANRLGRQVYFDNVIIRHDHHVNTRTVNSDNLYLENYRFLNSDKKIYNKRKFTKYDLSVLICTISSRNELFVKLLNRLTLLKQSTNLSIEVLYDSSGNISIGKKRNLLMNRALGTYCCFIDDDDNVTDDYFKVIENSGLVYDCISLNGMRYSNGSRDRPFYHSLKYTKWSTDENGYYRNPNHLNPMKTEIAKQIRFPLINNYEDRAFSEQLLKSGLLKTEYTHDKLQYLYFFDSNNSVSMSITNITNVTNATFMAPIEKKKELPVLLRIIPVRSVTLKLK